MAAELRARVLPMPGVEELFGGFELAGTGGLEAGDDHGVVPGVVGP